MRRFVVDLLGEVVERYPVQGVALLFNRQPPFVEAGDLDSVTQLLRELRPAVRGLPISAWVFGREADNRAVGLDVETWIREGLVQTLVPYSSAPRGFSWGESWTRPDEIEPWVALTRNSGTRLAPNVMPRDMSDSDHRRQALRLARAGVRALSFWDTGGRRSFLNGTIGRLGHVDELEAWEAAGEPPAPSVTRRNLRGRRLAIRRPARVTRRAARAYSCTRYRSNRRLTMIACGYVSSRYRIDTTVNTSMLRNVSNAMKRAW